MLFHPLDEKTWPRAVDDMETYADVKGVKAKPGRPDNFTSLSMLPWLSFTGHGCDTYTAPQMLFPIFLMGRWRARHGRLLLPVSLSLNHAAADGWHAAKAFHDLETLADNPQNWLR